MALSLIALFVISGLMMPFIPTVQATNDPSATQSLVDGPSQIGDGGWVLGAYVDYGGHTIASTMTVEYNIAVPTFNESSDIISPGVMTLGGYCGMTLDNGTVDSKVKCIFQNDVYYASNWSMNNPSGGSTTLNGFYWENEVWVDNQGSYALEYESGYNCSTYTCNGANTRFFTSIGTSALSGATSTMQTGASPNYYLGMSNNQGDSITYTQVNFAASGTELEYPTVLVPSFVLEQQTDANYLQTFSEQASFSPSSSCGYDCAAPFVYCGVECALAGSYYPNPTPSPVVSIGSCLLSCPFKHKIAADLQLNSYSGFSYGWELSFNNGGFSWNNVNTQIGSSKNPMSGALGALQTLNSHNTCTLAPSSSDPNLNDTSSGRILPSGCGSSFTMSYPNDWVYKGDLLIVAVGTTSSSATFTVSDPTGSGGQGNTWSSAVSQCTNDCVKVFYAVAKSSSADAVTITTTASGVYTYGFILEYGGLSGSVDKTSTGSGASGNPHVTSFSPSLGTAVFGIAAGPTGWTAGTGYIMIGSSTGWNAATEYGVDWNSTSTTVPWTGTSGSYGEAAASFS